MSGPAASPSQQPVAMMTIPAMPNLQGLGIAGCLLVGAGQMRDQLDHLPASKQRELAHVVRVLFEEFAEATARTTAPWKKQARILKVVLYGSYARGGWVDDPVGGYSSDYDILVVVNDERVTDVVDYWAAADDRLMRDTTINKALSAPVNFIVHSLKDVNKQLEQGRPFFIDIVEQGIVNRAGSTGGVGL